MLSKSLKEIGEILSSGKDSVSGASARRLRTGWRAPCPAFGGVWFLTCAANAEGPTTVPHSAQSRQHTPSVCFRNVSYSQFCGNWIDEHEMSVKWGAGWSEQHDNRRSEAGRRSVLSQKQVCRPSSSSVRP